MACVPFAWKEKTCHICKDHVLVAKSQSQVKIITGKALDSCNPAVSNICLLPRTDEVGIQNAACFAKLAGGAQISDIINNCIMTCYNDSKTLITQSRDQ